MSTLQQGKACANKKSSLFLEVLDLDWYNFAANCFTVRHRGEYGHHLLYSLRLSRDKAKQLRFHQV